MEITLKSVFVNSLLLERSAYDSEPVLWLPLFHCLFFCQAPQALCVQCARCEELVPGFSFTRQIQAEGMLSEVPAGACGNALPRLLSHEKLCPGVTAAVKDLSVFPL